MGSDPGETLTKHQARDLTDTIKGTVSFAWELITHAYQRRAWKSLGYQSWDAYCTAEFGAARLRLPREERAEVVSSLRESGLSVRAIASATGMNKETVNNVTRELSGNRTAESDADELAEELIAVEPESEPESEPEPAPVIGLDGKVYPKRQRPELELAWNAEEIQLRKRLEAGEPVVVNLHGQHERLIRWAQQRDLYWRVDRRSDWGNPFVMPDDGDRQTVITNYRDHYLTHKPSLLSRIGELRGKALGCWCAPEPCHADVLKELACRPEPAG